MTPAQVIAEHYNSTLEFQPITVSEWPEKVDVATVQDVINTLLIWERDNDIRFIAVNSDGGMV